MPKPLGFARLLLLSSALVAPSAAWAQTAPASQDPGAATQQPAVDPAAANPQEPATEPPAPEVSIPGGAASEGDIVVRGSRNRNIIRTTPEVVSVLSSADIARTGEGDIAGSLSRVTGLSVVGNGFVYVRGLGDRYSLALLNGSPLPSPEPLRRVVPLDIFPTSVIASSLVQKSYSVNFPGEFGGGVINLTTKVAPKDKYLTVSAGIGGDTVTTGQLGYTYFGTASDWTGFGNGAREYAPALNTFLSSGRALNNLTSFPQTTTGGTAGEQQALASQLVTGNNSVVQRNGSIPPNWSASLTGATSWEVGDDATLSLIATAGYSNKWRTRDTIQQSAASVDLSQRELDFERVITDDRIVVNGLIGLGLEFGRNKIRFTNLYIRDTLKQARIGIGTRTTSGNATLQQQDTAWFQRQLIDTQFAGEFKIGDVSVDVRGGYANTSRQAPNEFSYEYYRSNNTSLLPSGTRVDPYGDLFINRLNGNQGSASVAYSNLNENLWSGSFDISYKIIPQVAVSVGYAYADTNRRAARREFQFRDQTGALQPSGYASGVAVLRPDLLLAPAVIRAFGIGLIDDDPFTPVFRATLRNHGAYAQIKAELAKGLNLNAGVRYEQAKQNVAAIEVFTVPLGPRPVTNIDRSYWLPAATLTWELAPDMQLRASGSKTIARPQFRELIVQNYFDPEFNRYFRGNSYLQDSQLYNAELRYEWYFAREQRLSVAGFFKKINNPIESYSTFNDNTVVTSFVNAPEATLYGVEAEAQKYFDMSNVFGGDFFASRRAVLIANYTYTKSRIKVDATDTVAVFPIGLAVRATDYVRDGVPLTGQSDHLVNLQIGLEDKDHLSQQTFLFTYASKRVTSRGATGLPDIYEYPGIHLDFVARQGVKLFGVDTELKLEVRNITGQNYQEYQANGVNRIYYNRYNLGRVATLGVAVTF